MTDKLTTAEKGIYYEGVALQYLLDQGLKLIERNYFCKLGELDLIMQDGAFLVVVEVRYRKNNVYGGALESITKAKQNKVVAATQSYLMFAKIKSPVRCDVLAVTGNNAPVWIKGAF